MYDNVILMKLESFKVSDIVIHRILDIAEDLAGIAFWLDHLIMFLDNENTEHISRRRSNAEYIFNGQANETEKIFAFILSGLEREDFISVLQRYVNHTINLDNVVLRLAAELSCYELIKLLLKVGADVICTDEDGQTALHIACSKRSLEIVKILTENSPTHILEMTDGYRNTPLDIACGKSSPEIVQYLLSQGCNVLVNDDRSFGPVLSAMFNAVDDAVPIVNLLLDAGANINHRDEYGRTALMNAVELCAVRNPADLAKCTKYSYVDLSMLLIERGTDVNVADNFHQTALHLAIRSKQEILVRKLLICKCDINKHDNDGFTPLFYACESGSRALVDLLINCGANLRAQNWEAALDSFLNEEAIQLASYVIYKSNQCLTLENFCSVILRNKLRNVDKDVFQLGLPSVLVERIQLKD
ncbi:putative ankyrin repeat protein RF_0381 [Stegodyphus dumicola]|uniref:putative ankyrin repeat protein RF_0381 n=1 Tax=Stegodyphus dumicola TaxID=202533 RepID=UPI0015ABC77E|nr:putative ankyrin repeat protein RF_0381 [Stegodyphus dumicola]